MLSHGLAYACLMRCCWSMLAQSCHRSCTMFESAELGHRIDKARFREESPALRQALLEAQYELREARGFSGDHHAQRL